MPELPEVETTLRGLESSVTKQTVQRIIVRNHQLRWPIDRRISYHLSHHKIIKLSRRAKYLLWHFEHGTLITHLGMSGFFRIVPHNLAATQHDHVDIVLRNQLSIRYCDPRRFGAFVWTHKAPNQHRLLNKLGVEPLTPEFNSHYLYQQAQHRRCHIKSLIMNQQIVVGVGNIYASESLFKAGIHPQRIAKNISKKRLGNLVVHIQNILQTAIDAGGTTLRDFHNSEGKPGFFQFHLQVYGKNNLPCLQCGTLIKTIKQQQRTTYYCTQCQH